MKNPFSLIRAYSREARAIHEAGHAAAHHHFGHAIKFIEVHRANNGQWVGGTKSLTEAPNIDMSWRDDYVERMKQHIFATVIGAVAEEYATGGWNEAGYSGDEKVAFDYAYRLGYTGGEPVNEQLDAAKDWIGTPAAQTRIMTLAATLMETTVISGQIATRIMDEALIASVAD